MPTSLKEDSRPSFQFYPDDWLRDCALRLCSLAAQGLWVNMLCIMWYGKPRGTLSANGIPLDGKGLAKIVGKPPKEVERLLNELKTCKVYSVLENNSLCCRRMYEQWQRKEHISAYRTEAGKKGARMRWQKENKAMAKMTSSISSPASTSLSTQEESFNKSSEIPIQHLFRIFKKEWIKSHEGLPLFTTNDRRQAKTLWQKCQIDQPENPLAEFQRRCARIMKLKQLDNFAALLPFWNLGARVNADASISRSAPGKEAEILKRQMKEQQEEWRKHDEQAMQDLAIKTRRKQQEHTAEKEKT